MSRIGKRAVVRVLITIFLTLVPGAWAAGTYKTLYRFKDGKDGSYPQAGLILDADGNLYGTPQEHRTEAAQPFPPYLHVQLPIQGLSPVGSKLLIILQCATFHSGTATVTGVS
jgi:hypothetical protein